MDNLRINTLSEAKIDVRYLLNRGYEKRHAIRFVGTKYLLSKEEQHILFRAVFSDSQITERLKKKITADEIFQKDLSIDGFNQLIVIESMLRNKPIILCEDDFVRDISGVKSSYKISKETYEALDIIFEQVSKKKPRSLYFFFDSPISHSGKLSKIIKEKLSEQKIVGDAKAVKMADTQVLYSGEIVASSDSIVIERANKVFDLAGSIVKEIAEDKLIVL